MSLAETIRARFDAGAHRPPPLVGDGFRFVEGDPVPAAVLVAIVDRPEPALLLTKRNEAMHQHPGQIAFAGGRADPEDSGPIDTALREATEEIGMPRGAVELIGVDLPYETVSGFSITPVIGVVPPDLPLAALEYEVADIFEVPLAHVIDPANQVLQSASLHGTRRDFYEILWGDRRIWGVTAALIVNLSRWLRG